jgi:hypothetical protein
VFDDVSGDDAKKYLVYMLFKEKLIILKLEQ